MPLDRLAKWQRRNTYDPGEEHPWWADNVAHGVGGAVVGALAVSLLDVGLVGGGAVFLGVAAIWELYEWAFGIRPWDPREGWTLDRAIEDTLLDTYVGLTGALIAVWLL